MQYWGLIMGLEPYNTNNIVTEGLLVEQQFTNSYMKKG